MKTKVVKLGKSSSLTIKNYSSEIEKIVNSNGELIIDGTYYSLKDFKVKKIEDHYYVILIYSRY